jgi:hypothetical protein
VSRRCVSGCTNYGPRSASLDHNWLDHSIHWLLDSKPAAITSAPYHVNQGDEGRLAMWAAEPNLRAARGPGWYGHGTTQIILWRADRIGSVDPAEPPATRTTSKENAR